MSTSAVTKEDIKTFFQAVESAETPLDPSDPRYVKELYGEDEPALSLLDKILLSKKNTMTYFTGLRGTGKSTQLRNLSQHLQNNGYSTVLLDMSEYLSDNEPLDTVVFLIALAGAMGDALERELAHNPLSTNMVERLWRYLNETQITVKEVGGELGIARVGKVSFKAALQDQPSFKTKVQQANADSRTRLIAQGREMLAEMAKVLRDAQGKSQSVILVDSLERLHDPSNSNEGAVTESVRRLFDNDRAYIEISGTHSVYSVPPYLVTNVNFSGRVEFVQLGSVRVYEQPESALQATVQAGKSIRRRQERTQGLSKMQEVLSGIYPEWRKVIHPDTLDLLSKKSGGDLRQLLFRFVKDLALKAYQNTDDLPLTKDDIRVKNVLAKAQSQCELLVIDDDLPLLTKMANENQPRPDSLNDRLTLARFYENRCLLNYNNGTDWVDANPLLWDLLERYERRTAKH